MTTMDTRGQKSKFNRQKKKTNFQFERYGKTNGKHESATFWMVACKVFISLNHISLRFVNELLNFVRIQTKSNIKSANDEKGLQLISIITIPPLYLSLL